jgi:hypothetical protein
MLEDIALHEIVQRIGIPWARAKNGLLAQRIWIVCGFCLHPFCLALFIPKQIIKEQARRNRDPFQREQRLKAALVQCPGVVSAGDVQLIDSGTSRLTPPETGAKRTRDQLLRGDVQLNC